MRAARPVAALKAAALVGAAAALAPIQAQSLLQAEARVFAYDGLPAPGAGASFGGASAFDLPVIDAAGGVAFRARLTAPGLPATTERAIFYGVDAASLVLVVRGGDGAPGLAGLTLNGPSNAGLGAAVRLSSAGHVFFGSTLSGTGVHAGNDTATFAGPPGALALVAREGEPAPGAGGATYAGSFGGVFLNLTGGNANQAAMFRSTLAGLGTTTTNDEGLFAGPSSAVGLVRRKGDAVLNGEVLASFGATAHLNDVDMVLYDGVLAAGPGSPPVAATNDYVLWYAIAGSGDYVAVREGEAAPGTNGAVFGSVSGAWTPSVGAASFNRLGRFVFGAELTSGDVIAGVNDRALYAGGLGGLALVSRRGDPAPGTAAAFSTVSTGGLAMNATGDVLFEATLAGGGVTTADDSGVWTGAAGALRLVAREGSPAPQTAGAVFGHFSGLPTCFNDRGQALFVASLTGGDVTGPLNSAALYAYDPTGGVSLALRGGDALVLAPGVVKVVSSFSLVQLGGGDGAALAFNHAGDYVLRATMTDGTAAIVGGSVGTLLVEPKYLSGATGGTIRLRLNGGAARAGERYVVCGSTSGTTPGFDYGAFHVPLNRDFYFEHAYLFSNSGFLQDTLGNLDADGRALAQIHVPGGLSALAGLVLHHAFGTFDPTTGLLLMVSEVRPTTFVL